MIVKKNNKWYVYDDTGKRRLDGPFQTKNEAHTRLRQIEYYKEKKKRGK